MRGLGLPEEAGTGVGPFLRAVQEQARREGGEGGSGSSQGQSEGVGRIEWRQIEGGDTALDPPCFPFFCY